MWHELRFAARSLRKAPGFSAACVLTLAVGVGATIALFSVVYGILLRPLPYPNPDTLVRFTAERTIAGKTYGANFSAAEFPEWTGRLAAFRQLAAYGGTAFAVLDANGTSNVLGSWVSPEFFQVAGRPLLAGRGIATEDAHAPVAVVSRRFWAEHLAQRANPVGTTLVLDRESYTIIGIADDDFQIPSDKFDIWVPMGHGIDVGVPWLTNGGVSFIGRLADGVSLEQARNDARSVALAVATVYPRVSKDRRVDVVRLSDSLTEDIQPTLVVLAAAAGLVLVLTCVNLVNLQLARQVSRQREIAVRVALGASRAQLAVHALTESGLVVGAGSTAAIAAAWAVVKLLVWMRPADVPRLDAIRLDSAALLFAVAAAIVITLVISLVPLRALSVASFPVLQHANSRQTAGRPERRFRAALVAAELAAALVLLVGTVLLATSFARLLRTDIGVNAEHVMTAFVDLSAGQVAAKAQATAAEHQQLAEILRLLSNDPRVQSAGAGTSMPPSVSRLRLSFKWNRPRDGVEVDKAFDAEPVSPGLFRTLGVPLLLGRDFTDADRIDSAPVAILSRGAAVDLFGTNDAIGRQLPIPALVPDKRAASVTIIGVVADVHYGGIEAPAGPTVYVPFAQYPYRVVHLFARSRGTPEAAAAPLREAVNRVDRRIAIIVMQPMTQSVADALAQPRFRTVVFAGISTIAVVLAIVGLSGLIAYSVSQRRTEIGIRLALGASPGVVLRMIIGEAARLSGAGILVGIALAFVSVRVLKGLLYQVAPGDAPSFTIAAVALFAVALLASYLPARAVTRIDPVRVLGSE